MIAVGMKGSADISLNGAPADLTPTSNDAESSEPYKPDQPAEEGRTVIAFEEAFWKTDQPAGTVCYVIPFDWWKAWCDYTGFKLEDKHTGTIQVELKFKPLHLRLCGWKIYQKTKYMQHQGPFKPALWP